MIGFYQQTMPGYSAIALSLHDLTKKGAMFTFGEKEREAFV